MVIYDVSALAPTPLTFCRCVGRQGRFVRATFDVVYGLGVAAVHRFLEHMGGTRNQYGIRHTRSKARAQFMRE